MLRAATLALALALGAALGGCRSAAFTKAQQLDTPDGWRGFLADHEVGTEPEAARERLEHDEWLAAQASDTPLSYRRYLASFPGGPHADEARARIGALRGEAAAARDPTDLDATESAGAAAAAAFAQADATQSPAPLRAYLASHPEGPRAAEAQAREDDLSFAQALHGDGVALAAYVDLHPQAAHRAAVEALLAGREAWALAWEDRFVEADQRLQLLLEGAERLALEREICARQARALLAAPEALADLPAPKGAPSGLALALADDAAVGLLARGLEADRAEDGIEAAWALADTGAPAALDPLLRALGPEHLLSVRWAALQAVERLAAGWPVQVREVELRSREAALKERAASAALWLRQAVVEQALGWPQAAETLGRAQHDAPEDALLWAAALRRDDLVGAERAAVRDRLSGALAAQPGADVCGRAALLRLTAASPDPAATPGCSEGPPAPVRSAEQRRVTAIASLGPLLPRAPALAAQLGRLAERDGSPAVRAAAAAALGGRETLGGGECRAPRVRVGGEVKR